MTVEKDVDSIIADILRSIEIAKQGAMAPLRELRDKYTEEGSDSEGAKNFIRKISNSEGVLGRYDVKNLITSVALTHNIYCSIGDYGNGEELYLADSNWSDYKRGDWVSSSEGC